MFTTIAQELKPTHTKSCDITSSIVREDDVQQHVEDDFLYTAIRNNKLVLRTWHQLTECEQRDIYCQTFDIY